LGLKASDFSLDKIEVSKLPFNLNKQANELIVTMVDRYKQGILEHMSDRVSDKVLKAANTALFQEIQAVHKFYPCSIDKLVPVPEASRVCFSNNAAFAMKWGYSNCPLHEVSIPSEPFPIGKSTCMDVQDIWPDAEEGQVLRATTMAIAGIHEVIDPAIRFKPNSNVAAFQCDGTTLLYNCKLISVAPEDSNTPIPASRICVSNQAAFVLHFDAQNLRTEKWVGKTTDYPVTQKRCLDVASMDDIGEGDTFKTKVHAVAGKDLELPRVVEFSKSGYDVTFVCKGTTLNYKCDVITEARDFDPTTSMAPGNATLTTTTGEDESTMLTTTGTDESTTTTSMAQENVTLTTTTGEDESTTLTTTPGKDESTTITTKGTDESTTTTTSMAPENVTLTTTTVENESTTITTTGTDELTTTNGQDVSTTAATVSESTTTDRGEDWSTSTGEGEPARKSTTTEDSHSEKTTDKMTSTTTTTTTGQFVEASSLCVLNKAMFELTFDLKNVQSKLARHTEKYSVEDEMCLDLSDVDPEGKSEFNVRVTPDGGNTTTMNETIVFKPSAEDVTFKCNGTDLDFACYLVNKSHDVGTLMV